MQQQQQGVRSMPGTEAGPAPAAVAVGGVHCGDQFILLPPDSKVAEGIPEWALSALQLPFAACIRSRPIPISPCVATKVVLRRLTAGNSRDEFKRLDFKPVPEHVVLGQTVWFRFAGKDVFAVVESIETEEEFSLERNSAHPVNGKTLFVWTDKLESDSFLDKVVVPEALMRYIELLREFLSDSPVAAYRAPLLEFAGAVDALLVHGPAGVGKTTSIRRLAVLSPLTFEFISALEFCSATPPPSVEETSSFKVVVVDDLDELVCSSASSSSASQSLLKLLRSISQSTTMALIGVIEHADEMTSPFRSLFVRDVAIAAPAMRSRAKLIFSLLDKHSIEDSYRIAQITPGYVARDLVHLCRDIVNREIIDMSGVPLRSIVRRRKHVSSAVQIGSHVRPLPRSSFAGYARVRSRVFAIADYWAVHGELEHPSGSSKDLSALSSNVVGVLFHGPTGCGKTLLARALACDDRLNFLTAQASDLLSRYVGESERNVRNLFRQARQMRPCVVFLDELDGLGRARSCGDAAADSRAQNRVLSTLLNELDGVESRSGVFVVGACQDIRALDSALVRPGRFDSAFELPLPDFQDRCDILSCSLAGAKVPESVSIEELARRSEGLSGAEIEMWCREAKLCALRRDLDNEVVETPHFEEAFEKLHLRQDFSTE